MSDPASASTAGSGHGALSRLVVSVGTGLVVGVVVGLSASWSLGLLGGFATLHLVFLSVGWKHLWPMDPDDTRRHAGRESFPPPTEELVVVLISVGALIGIGVVLVQGGSARTASAVLALVAVFLAWGSLHLMYAGRYAKLYYEDEPAKVIDFNSAKAPRYVDFFYFSYNLGMTYQVSDTNVSGTDVRAVVLRHCLLSYIFGAVVLATTINLVAGIATG